MCTTLRTSAACDSCASTVLPLEPRGVNQTRTDALGPVDPVFPIKCPARDSEDPRGEFERCGTGRECLAHGFFWTQRRRSVHRQIVLGKLVPSRTALPNGPGRFSPRGTGCPSDAFEMLTRDSREVEGATVPVSRPGGSAMSETPGSWRQSWSPMSPARPPLRPTRTTVPARDGQIRGVLPLSHTLVIRQWRRKVIGGQRKIMKTSPLLPDITCS
jgi:hypothetical protein